MTMPKYNNMLVMSATGDYAFAIANVLIGIKRHSENFFDKINIYHTGINDSDKKCINKIIPCNFIFYSPNIPKTNANIIKRFSIASFAVYEVFDLLNTSRHVIYLDADTLIHKDISGILHYGPVALYLRGRILEKALGTKPPQGIDGNQHTGNSGVVLVSDTIDYKGMTELCYKKTLEYFDTLVLPDQAILSLAFNLRNIQINPLPSIYNSTLNTISPDQIITHQVTSRKFWPHGLVNFLAPEWRKNNEIWISHGGTPYQGSVTLAEFVRLKTRTVDRLSFILHNFEKKVIYFLEEFASSFCGARNIRYSIDKRKYCLNIPIVNDFLTRFEVKIICNTIRIKLYTQNINFFHSIDTKLFLDKRNSYEIKEDNSSGHIIYIINLNDSQSFEKDGVFYSEKILTELIDIIHPNFYYLPCVQQKNFRDLYIESDFIKYIDKTVKQEFLHNWAKIPYKHKQYSKLSVDFL
jgi:lipopolysaccharide biosynthesis glycosyltransferase